MFALQNPCLWGTLEHDHFWKEDLWDAIELWFHTRLAWTLNPVAGTLGKRRGDTERRRPLEDGGTTTSQQVPRNARSSQKWAEAGKNSPLKPSEGAQVFKQLDFRLLVSETTHEYICCFKPSYFWWLAGIAGKLIQKQSDHSHRHHLQKMAALGSRAGSQPSNAATL